jgi:membrane-bound metal-dependent hydrolase YbcI (DUF457 family)
MGRTGHHLTGVAAGILVAAVGLHQGSGMMSLVAIPAGYFGGTAPDWLEMSRAVYSTRRQRWVRRSVITHRTITHWWPVWMLALILALLCPTSSLSLDACRMAALGFVAGGFMHLAMDIPNPSGIPIRTPYARSRFGFGWWKSGNAMEPLAGVVMVALSTTMLWVALGAISIPVKMFRWG